MRVKIKKNLLVPMWIALFSDGDYAVAASFTEILGLALDGLKQS